MAMAEYKLIMICPGGIGKKALRVTGLEFQSDVFSFECICSCM